MKNKIPFILIYLRLLLGIALLILSCMSFSHYTIYAVAFLVLGLLTDIFDGIIARILNISGPALRRLDSTVDQLFFILILIATFIHNPQFFYNNKAALIILFSIELLAYLVCFIKFRKEVATHSIASKIWTLVLVATLMQIIITNDSGILFQFCFYIGIVTRLEIIAIILLLPKWENDIPSFFQAIQLRQGKQMKRNKFFNG